jgi:protease-4
MNQFLKFTLASCLGLVLSVFVLGFIGIVLLAGIAGSTNKTAVHVEEKSVLHLTFSNIIPEQTNNIQIDPLAFSTNEVPGLRKIVETIDYAASDPKIKGIYLNPEMGLNAGVATASVVRKSLEKFKESGKFIIAYAKNYTQGGYYVASVADSIYLNPMGSIDIAGFSAMVPFFKGMLDKIGVRMQVFYAGDFKSATEPYRLYKMSDASRLQLREYLDPVYANFLADLGRSRNKTPEELRRISDELRLKSPEDAVENGLVDKVAYSDEVLDFIKSKIGLSAKDKIKVISLEDYASTVKPKKELGKDKVAIVYAEGSILMGTGERGTIADDKYVKIIRKIRDDQKFKAIVLRVNSPGGSALASENIWRELNLAKEKGLKVVVSMGDYAASGGYYISCMADKIVAEPNTLTGSIGVFSMIPNARVLMNDKLGVTFDTVKTAKYSTGINPFFDLAPEEEAYMTEMTVDVYEKFLERVSVGRNMKRDDVHKIAQGRIWVGTKAKEIGLVDEIGDLDAAIKLAGDIAGIENFKLYEYPIQKDPIQEVIDNITGQGGDKGLESKLLRKELGQYFPVYKHLIEIKNSEGVQARLPVLVPFR